MARVEIDQVNVWERLRRVLGERPARAPSDSRPTSPRCATGSGWTDWRARPASNRPATWWNGCASRRTPRRSPPSAAAAELAQDALAERAARRACRGNRARRRRPAGSGAPAAGAANGIRSRRSSPPGPRAALPHARTSDRTIVAGEWLLLDFGAQVDGYCADLTRTVVVGARADERQRAVYEIVRQAQRRALEHVRAGMTGSRGRRPGREMSSRDRATARRSDILSATGWAWKCTRRPGSRRPPETPLPAGAVVTVEPGIYLPGWGGVRLEDDVHLTADGRSPPLR